MKRIEGTKKLLIFAGMAAVICAALYALVIQQFYQKNQQMADYEKQIAQKINKEHHLRSVKNLLESTESKREKLAGYFIEENETAQFIALVEKLGAKAGVSVDVSSVGLLDEKQDKKEGQNKFYDRLEISVSSKGGWEEVYHFYSLLGTMPYDVKTRNVRLVNVESKEGRPTAKWRGKFSFVVTRLK